MSDRTVVGRYSTERRFTPRRMSDINPYARLDVDEPVNWDRIIGRVCATGIVAILASLAFGWLA